MIERLLRETEKLYRNNPDIESKYFDIPKFEFRAEEINVNKQFLNLGSN